MPTFDTPEPISVTVELGVGDIRLVASERTDTVVEVRPSDDTKKAEVTAAQQTRVEYANGRLLIKAPKGWRQYSFRGGGESIDVQIDLPAGSHVRGAAGVAAFHCSGRLGECHLTTGVARPTAPRRWLDPGGRSSGAQRIGGRPPPAKCPPEGRKGPPDRSRRVASTSRHGRVAGGMGTAESARWIALSNSGVLQLAAAFSSPAAGSAVASCVSK